MQQHRSADSCWVVLYGKVYDVTSFIPEHPGGSKIILQLAGQDATEEYDPIHPEGTLEGTLPSSALLGSIDASTLPSSADKSPAQEQQIPEAQMPTLDDCLNMHDIEKLATLKMSKKAWAYYFSAGDDLISKTLNNTVYHNILLRPRVFADVTHCSTATTILGSPVNIPFFVSPAAMARLGHPDGEAGIAAACRTYGACPIISNNASPTPEQICANASPTQVFGWQLYVQVDRQRSEAMLARIHKIPQIKFIVLTLDAPVPGKREHDEREGRNVGANLPVRSAAQQGVAPSSSTADPEGASASPIGKDPKAGQSVAQAMFAGTACDLTWEATLPWLAQHTQLPIVLKGLQTHEDVYQASLYPQIKGVILSNHGGRSVDTAPPSIHTLLEVRKYCPEVFGKLEVFVDGGIKRGTDIVKALALGAKAVGIGRNALYGLGAGGKEGVARVLEILKAEVETAMRLLAVERVDQLGPQHVSLSFSGHDDRDFLSSRFADFALQQVNTRAVERDIYDGPTGFSKVGMWVSSKL